MSSTLTVLESADEISDVVYSPQEMEKGLQKLLEEISRVLTTISTSLGDRPTPAAPHETASPQATLNSADLTEIRNNQAWHARIGWGITGIFAFVFAGLITWYLPKELAQQTANQKSDFAAELGRQLGPLNTQLASLNATVELLKPDGSKRIGAVLKEKTKGHGGELRLNLETAQQLARKATDRQIPTDRAEVSQAGESFVRVSFDNKDVAEPAWNTTLEVARYVSFLNSELPAAVQRVNQEAKELGIRTPLVGLIVRPLPLYGGFDQIQANLQSQASESKYNVPASIAAVFALRTSDAAKNSVAGAAYITVVQATITLDGLRCRNIIFKDCKIIYQGGGTDLDNVEFINCSFEIPRIQSGERFAKALFGPPALTFN